MIFFDLRIDGRQLKEVPMLIADLGNHEIILGRKWLAEQESAGYLVGRQESPNDLAQRTISRGTSEATK